MSTADIPLDQLLADPRIAALVEAASPFARLGHGVLEVRQEEDKTWVWEGGEQRQRITCWFGPSDFGRLIGAFQELGLPLREEDGPEISA